MIVSLIGSFFCYTILGRKMSVNDYALFSTVLALTTMISVFTNNIAAGIVANREIAVSPFASFKILRCFFFIRLAAFLGAVIFLFIYVIYKYPSDSVIFWPAFILLIQNVFWELFEQISFGLKITKISMFLNIIATLLWAAYVVFIPKENAILLLVLMGYASIYLVKTICYGVWLYKYTKQYSDNSYSVPTKQLILYSMPYLYNRILGTFTTQLPVLLLTGYSELKETAFYAMGEKYTTPITVITSVAISALFPFFTKTLKDDHQKAAKFVSDGILFVISFGACLAVILCSISEFLLVFLLGENYRGAAGAFNYQVWFAIICSVDCIISMVLSCDYKQKTLSVVTTIDVIVSLLFIWKGMNGGAEGVAFAKLIAAVLCLIYHLVIISKLYGNRSIMLRLLLSWGLFLLLFYITLFQNNNVLRIIAPLVALVCGIYLNKYTLRFFVKKSLLHRIERDK
jgi:O-antigen/teichoic acid export membrane protein